MFMYHAQGKFPNRFLRGGFRFFGGVLYFFRELDFQCFLKCSRADPGGIQFLDFNQPFKFEDNLFELCTSAFAIYYASDLDFTFGEAHRVLKPGGRLFVSGPLPENKQMFYDIIKEATGAAIPPMPGSSRFKGDIFNTISKIFAKTELHKFENHLTFPEVTTFMDYVRASLGEDRK